MPALGGSLECAQCSVLNKSCQQIYSPARELAVNPSLMSQETPFYLHVNAGFCWNCHPFLVQLDLTLTTLNINAEEVGRTKRLCSSCSSLDGLLTRCMRRDLLLTSNEDLDCEDTPTLRQPKVFQFCYNWCDFVLLSTFYLYDIGEV